jgi:hypothetical protein
VLGRLGFQFTSRGDEGNERGVDEDCAAQPQFIAELADRLEKRQAFDIAHRASDLAQHEIQVVGIGPGEGLDRIRHVRNHLNRRAQEIAATFFGQQIEIDPPGSYIVGLARRDAGEAFIVAEIEIGLGTVVGHIDLAVLDRAHRAGIDIQIGIEFADAHPVAAGLQQRAKRCCHQTLAKRGYHAAGDEDEPGHGKNRIPCGWPPVTRCGADRNDYPQISDLAGERHFAGLWRCGRGRAGKAGIDRARGTAARCHPAQRQRGEDEKRGKDRRHPRQQVGRPPGRHQAAGRSTAGQAAAFRLLHQNDTDEGECEKSMHDQQKCHHEMRFSGKFAPPAP